MTTIIGRKLKDGTLQLAGDKRTTLGNGMFKDESIKVLQLDNILLGKSGDALSNKLLLELYEIWKIDNGEILNVLKSIDFYNFVKKNCNIKNINNENGEPTIAFIIMHKDFQIQIDSSGQVSELGDEGILTIGSGSSIVLTTYGIANLETVKYNLELEDYFEIVSSMDAYTSKSYDVLELLPEVLIQTN